MTGADYYINESSNEWEAVERWENEGGRGRQNYGLSLDSIGEDYTSHGACHPHRQARRTW